MPEEEAAEELAPLTAQLAYAHSELGRHEEALAAHQVRAPSSLDTRMRDRLTRQAHNSLPDPQAVINSSCLHDAPWPCLLHSLSDVAGLGWGPGPRLAHSAQRRLRIPAGVFPAAKPVEMEMEGLDEPTAADFDGNDVLGGQKNAENILTIKHVYFPQQLEEMEGLDEPTAAVVRNNVVAAELSQAAAGGALKKATADALKRLEGLFERGGGVGQPRLAQALEVQRIVSSPNESVAPTGPPF